MRDPVPTRGVVKLTPRQEQLIRLTSIDYQSTSEFLENPVVIDRAEGLYYWDCEGKRYFDAIGGIFVATLGHRHPRVMDAMMRQTGFAKTGNMFAAQTFRVTPDIICSGKGISSGAVPLGTLIAKREMAEAFQGTRDSNVHFSHGHTFAGNPLACAVGVAVIEQILEQDLCAKAERLGECIASRLGCLRKLGLVREIRGKGVLRGVEFTHAGLGVALKKTALRNGIILRIDPSWFAVCPPLIAEEADIEEMCELIHKSIVEAAELSKV